MSPPAPVAAAGDPIRGAPVGRHGPTCRSRTSFSGQRPPHRGTACDDGPVTVNSRDCWPAEPRLLDVFDTAALVADLSGVIVYGNEVAQRLFAARMQALEGGGLLARLFEDSERVAMADAVHQVLDGSPWRAGWRWRAPTALDAPLR